MPHADESPTEAPIALTEEAAAYVRERLEREGKAGGALRVGVRGGGCNGLVYVLELTADPPRARDRVLEQHGARMLLDERSIDYIVGSTVYFENTLMFQGLKFKNPNEGSTCGCGETFSLKAGALDANRARKLATTS
ncbi:MAG: iron-sulfur cluster assembly accessory protein [Deltaproteobacteria bacterium]|nr:iron-sulfur cluster assembly accessory protein [Deltaproteobacteria bacterium]